jgi:hypothetical protein
VKAKDYCAQLSCHGHPQPCGGREQGDCTKLRAEAWQANAGQIKASPRHFNGASEADIRAACGFGRSHIYRLITERCLAQHPDGNVTRTHGTPLRLKLGHIFCCVSVERELQGFFNTK